MTNEQPVSTHRWRPRVSLLTALLLMTIAGMAIVLAQLWREVGPLRARVRQLQDETGRLTIDDSTKIHAMQVRTNEPLFWKWRVWVPDGATVTAYSTWGSVPRDGVPAAQCGVTLEPGDQWVTLRVMRDSTDDTWIAQLETNGSCSGVKIVEKDRWWEGPAKALAAPGVGFTTATVDDLNKPFVLERHRIGSNNNSSDLLRLDSPTAGFIIWLDRK